MSISLAHVYIENLKEDAIQEQEVGQLLPHDKVDFKNFSKFTQKCHLTTNDAMHSPDITTKI